MAKKERNKEKSEKKDGNTRVSSLEIHNEQNRIEQKKYAYGIRHTIK